jgi:hypothetical protein
MSDHDPYVTARLALDEKNDPTKARTQAFERWRRYLEQRAREKAAEQQRKSA